jgi:hypothetical protein
VTGRPRLNRVNVAGGPGPAQQPPGAEDAPPAVRDNGLDLFTAVPGYVRLIWSYGPCIRPVS